MNKDINAINKKKKYAGIIFGCIMRAIKDAIVIFAIIGLYVETIFYILKSFLPLLYRNLLTGIIPFLRLEFGIIAIIFMIGIVIEASYSNMKKLKNDKMEDCSNE